MPTISRLPLSPTTVIIIIEIEKRYYVFRILYSYWFLFFLVLTCPACGTQDRFIRHARYTKYYYTEKLWILRLKCEDCGTTHAVIPSFSLPDTSSGTKEAETCLIKRADGESRGTCGKILELLGLSEKYTLQLDKMFQKSIDRAKALFPEGDGTLNGMRWVRSVGCDRYRPLYSLNCFCLARGVNAVCFSRVSILIFRIRRAGRAFSHNMGLTRTRL